MDSGLIPGVYAQENYKLAAEAASMPRRFSVTERLEAEKRTLEDRLAQVNKALDALKANPDFQSLFDLISRTI